MRERDYDRGFRLAMARIEKTTDVTDDTDNTDEKLNFGTAQLQHRRFVL
jgi:hypothetical protein